MSEKEFETLVIKYRAQKEHIDAIKEAAMGMKLETFFHMCVVNYLEHFYYPKRVNIPKNLFRKLAAKAKDLNLTPDEYANQLLIERMQEEKAL